MSTRLRTSFRTITAAAAIGVALSVVAIAPAQAHNPGHCGHLDYPSGSWYTNYWYHFDGSDGWHYNVYEHFYNGVWQHDEYVVCGFA